MSRRRLQRIATIAAAAAAVTAVAAGCGAATMTADPSSVSPEVPATTSEAPTEVTLAPSTAAPADPGNDSGDEAVPPVVITPAPPTGGGKGGH